MLGKTNVKIKPKKKVEYVEYIESTGTQYIDTGFVPNQNSGIEIKLYANSSNSNFNAPFGARNANTKQFFVGLQTDSNETWFMRYGDEQYISTYGSKIGENLIIIDKNRYTINGSSYSFPITTFECPGNMFLFGCNNTNDTSTRREFYGRIYYCKIYDNGNLIRDFRPVKDGAGVYCLYDEVEKRYYYNQGTGEFLGGVAA